MARPKNTANWVWQRSAFCLTNGTCFVVAAAGPERRGQALGVLSAAQAVGLSAGPAIGGLVLDLLDWRWVFWINVPFGLLGTVMGWFVLPPTRDLPDDDRFRAAAFAALRIAIEQDGEWPDTELFAAFGELLQHFQAACCPSPSVH